MDQFQQFIHTSRYARFLPELGRRETWEETVKRYFDFFADQLGDKVPAGLRDELQEAVTKLEVMPSMRALMTAGPALERCHIASYNCSYIPISSLDAFHEAMYILLAGTGVGFSVESRYVSQLPEVSSSFGPAAEILHVTDSKEGWAVAFRRLIQLLYQGQIPAWNLSQIRPAGTPLKTFGGRASGPEPLNRLFEFTVDLICRASGRRLTTLEAHDLMCMVAEVVVVGGTRRSAMLSLSDLDDELMRGAKSGEWWVKHPHRALANNSAVFLGRPDQGVFMDEWTALYKSKSGERGIFNRHAANDQVKKTGRRKLGYEFGVNPCCVSGDTLILTDFGHIPIKDTIGKEVNIWNGQSWAKVTPFETGVYPLYRVKLSDETYLDCTANHKFVLGIGYTGNTKKVETKDLITGDTLAKFEMPVLHDGIDPGVDAYSQGFYSGDGLTDYAYSWVYAPKYPCIPRLIGSFAEEAVYNGVARKTWTHGAMLPKDFIPVGATSGYCLNWLAGLLDSDGTVTRDKNGNGFQISSVDKEFLLGVHLMLTRLGVRAKLNVGNSAGLRWMPDGKGGRAEYPCQEGWRLLIGNMDTYRLLQLGLQLNRLEVHNNPPQRDARQFVRVVDVEDLNREEMTYCFHEPFTKRGTFNGIVTGQSEIILRPQGLCNLSSIVVRKNDDLHELSRKARLAAILGTWQSTLTDFPILRPEWKKNAEEERLLGVSMVGIMDGDLTKDADPLDLKFLRRVVLGQNEITAGQLGIPASASVTAVKPEGTCSQLVNAASGIHSRHSPYYIRTVRADKKDPLTQFMIAAGFPAEDCVMRPDSTTIFSFPVKSPEGAITRHDRSAINQLDIWLKYKNHWCEHNPSVTISVRETEWFAVADWVWKHFDDVLGISFLPYSDHVYQQAPYQECTRDEYLAHLAKMPGSVDWTGLQMFESTDHTVGAQTLACVGGVCEI